MTTKTAPEALGETPVETLTQRLIAMVERTFHITAVDHSANIIELPLSKQERLMVTISRKDPVMGYLKVHIDLQVRRQIPGALALLSAWESSPRFEQITFRHPQIGAADAERDLWSYLAARLAVTNRMHLIR